MESKLLVKDALSMRAGLKFAMLMLAFATVQAHAQSHARFWVEPADRATSAGIGTPDTEFTFTADVTDALRYRIDFGDGTVEDQITPRADDTAQRIHRYRRAGDYTATMTAWRTDEVISLPISVRVTAPPPPAVVPPAPQPVPQPAAPPALLPEVSEPGAELPLVLLPLIIFLLATATILIAADAATEICFEPNVDPGESRVTQGEPPGKPVSFRLHKDPGRIEIRKPDGEPV